MNDPTWADILVLFTQPYWITPPEKAKERADYWVEEMLYKFNLRKYKDVKSNITNIISQAKAGTMPPPPDEGEHTERFPPEAIQLLQRWKNIECPEFEE